jgi:hypothetical protein
MLQYRMMDLDMDTLVALIKEKAMGDKRRQEYSDKIRLLFLSIVFTTSSLLTLYLLFFTQN